MRKTLGVCLLVLLLTGSAGAGIIPNDAPAPPPPAGVVEEQADAVEGPAAVATVEDGTQGSATQGALTQTVLDLLAVLPSLL